MIPEVEDWQWSYELDGEEITVYDEDGDEVTTRQTASVTQAMVEELMREIATVEMDEDRGSDNQPVSRRGMRLWMVKDEQLWCER